MKTAELLREPVRWENDAPHRRVSITPMDLLTLYVPDSPPWPQEPEVDPFYLGCRLVKGLHVPLSAYDVRHPLEDDYIVTSFFHQFILRFLATIIYSRLTGRTILYSDVRTDWQVPGQVPVGPDICVQDDCQIELRDNPGTIRVQTLGARTKLVVEVTSESTIANDLGYKVEYYQNVGVEKYVIVDLLATPRVMLGYELIDGIMYPMPLDERGRIELPDVANLVMGFDEEGFFQCWDATTGELLRDLKEEIEVRKLAEDKAKTLEKERDLAQEKAKTLEKERNLAQEKAKTLEKERDAAREAREKAEKDAKALAKKYADLLARLGASEDQPPASGS